VYVFQSTAARSLKKTLNKIIDDKMDGYKSAMIMPTWMDESPMEDAYVDDLEMGGPGLLVQKLEGQDVPMGTIQEGAQTRYTAATYALGIGVSEEILEDAKYPEVIRAAMRLKRALYITVDVSSAQVLVRMFNTGFPLGDGQPLGSTTHTLPNGSTFSNQMAVAMAPSRAAVTIVRAQIRKLPSHDGINGAAMLRGKCILCPVDQESAWEVILGSKNAPEPGEYNALNIANKMNLDLYPNVFWNNTTTNWGMKTDAEDGFKFFWRRRPRSRSWINNEQGIMKYSIDARWVSGCSEPRIVICSNA